MSKSYSKEEMMNMFLQNAKVQARYWAMQECSDKEKTHGLLHSMLCMIDGVSGGFPCSIELVLRPHPDDKQYCIDNEEKWVEDGMCINDDVYLHEEIGK